MNNSKDKEKKATRNKNVINDKEFNPKINSENPIINQNNTKKKMN